MCLGAGPRRTKRPGEPPPLFCVRALQEVVLAVAALPLPFGTRSWARDFICQVSDIRLCAMHAFWHQALETQKGSFRFSVRSGRETIPTGFVFPLRSKSKGRTSSSHRLLPWRPGGGLAESTFGAAAAAPASGLPWGRVFSGRFLVLRPGASPLPSRRWSPGFLGSRTRACALVDADTAVIR